MIRLGALVQIALATTMAAACTTAPELEIPASEFDAKADGLASRLKLRDDHKMDIDEPSDLAFHKGKLYAVSDRHSKIYVIDPDDGDPDDDINIDSGSDLEALAIDDDGDYFVAVESGETVLKIGSDGDRKDEIDVDTNSGNSGIEGLAFDDDGHLYVANEKSPAEIIELNEDGEEKRSVKLDFADDLSALAWNPEDGHLYALSDAEQKLWRLDNDLDKITAWDLPIDHPEGLAFDGDTVYIASDSEERLYVFELD